MASFNPYLEWLGIKSSERLLDHYTLLNLPRFEGDLAAIRRAADAQKSRIRSVRPGANMSDWQRLLDEFEAAADCLATPAKKASYDAHLRELPLPDESVLNDPAEQATAAASSIIAGSAESHLFAESTVQQPTSSSNASSSNASSSNASSSNASSSNASSSNASSSNAATRSHVGPQPTHNLMPPTIAPSAGTLHTNQPPEIGKEEASAVPSLTSNPLPPTFGDGPTTDTTTVVPVPPPPTPPPNPALSVQAPTAVPGNISRTAAASSETIAPPPPPPNPARLLQKPFEAPAGVSDTVTTTTDKVTPASELATPPTSMSAPASAAAAPAAETAAPAARSKVIPIEELLPPTAVIAPGRQPQPTTPLPGTAGMVAQLPMPAAAESPNATTAESVASAPESPAASMSRLPKSTIIAIALSLLMLSAAGIVYVVDQFGLWVRQEPIVSSDEGGTTDSPTTPPTDPDDGATAPETPMADDPPRTDPVPDPNADPTPVPDPDGIPEPNSNTESVPDPDPMPDPLPKRNPRARKSNLPQITEQQLNEIERYLSVAKQALKSRDPRHAIEQVAHARAITALFANGPHAAKVERMRMLSDSVGYFWDAVAKGMEDLTDKDLKIGTTTIHILAANPELIRYRRSGTNEVRTRMEMPPGLIRAIGEHWLDDTPASQVLIGAFLAVESRYGPDRARELWQNALETGEPISMLMPVLDEI